MPTTRSLIREFVHAAAMDTFLLVTRVGWGAGRRGGEGVSPWLAHARKTLAHRVGKRPIYFARSFDRVNTCVVYTQI